MRHLTVRKHKGFALFTGLILLLVLTLISIVVMRGTRLELAMTTAATGQEQAVAYADSARSIARELRLESFEIAEASQGNLSNSGYGGLRPGNVPPFLSIACNGGGDLFNNSPLTNPNVFLGANDFSSTSTDLRIQTINAPTRHLGPFREAKQDCAEGKMGMSTAELGMREKVGDAVGAGENRENTQILAAIGYGDSVSGSEARVVGFNDILISR
jgi:Tfp pilus assembly protein PilX